jgi:hypothetical protein
MVQVKLIIVVATVLTTLALSGCKAHVKPTHGRMAVLTAEQAGWLRCQRQTGLGDVGCSGFSTIPRPGISQHIAQN